MNDVHIILSKFTGGIYRCTQSYANEMLKQFGVTCGSYPYLLTLYNNDGINQNKISRELDIDKAMSAREIKKLIRLGYVRKEMDQEDARAYKLYLTESGRSLIPEICLAMDRWNDTITKGLDDEEKKELVRMLDIVLQEARRHRYVPKSDA
jgi:DNA-binding MarR family transcriptional regulator